jgi:hypothetical protein
LGVIAALAALLGEVPVIVIELLNTLLVVDMMYNVQTNVRLISVGTFVKLDVKLEAGGVDT